MNDPNSTYGIKIECDNPGKSGYYLVRNDVPIFVDISKVNNLGSLKFFGI